MLLNPLLAQMLFSLGPPFSVFIDSLLDKTALLIWPDAFYLLSKGQRPSQEEWWVVYTLEMQQNCCIYTF